MPFQAPVVPTRKSLEYQVLEDLASTDNELEKLEILDSYAAYSQRCYRTIMTMGFTQQASRLAEAILAPWIREAIPPVHVAHRGAKADR
jgi:hypothetical protein